MKRKKLGRKAWAGIGAILASASVATALIFLFTQTAPPIQTANMAANCATLTPSVQLVVPGSSGEIVYDCGGIRAFSVSGGSSVPTFTLGTGENSLWVFSGAFPPANTPCANVGGAIQLTSGGTVNWGGSSNDDYCLEFSSVPSGGLASWTTSWSQ